MRWVAVDTDGHCASRVSVRCEVNLTSSLLLESAGTSLRHCPLARLGVHPPAAGNAFGLSAPPDDRRMGCP